MQQHVNERIGFRRGSIQIPQQVIEVSSAKFESLCEFAANQLKSRAGSSVHSSDTVVSQQTQSSSSCVNEEPSTGETCDKKITPVAGATVCIRDNEINNHEEQAQILRA